MTCHIQLKRKYITDDALEQIDRRNICEAACLGVPDEMLTPGCVAELRRAILASQQYLLASLPEYPVGDPQRKRIMDQLDANSRALGNPE